MPDEICKHGSSCSAMYRAAVSKQKCTVLPAFGRVLWQPFRCPSSVLWQPFGSSLAPLWHPFGIPLVALWQPFDSTLAAVWHPFGSPLEEVWQTEWEKSPPFLSLLV